MINQNQINPNISKQLVKKVAHYRIYLNQKLGQGNYGAVYLCIDSNEKEENQKYYAVKVVPRFLGATDSISQIQKEISILQNIKHENIAQLHEVQVSDKNIYLFLDYCNNGDLRSYLKQKQLKLPEIQALDIVKQITKGYLAILEQKVIHRDLKPENILLHNGMVKICDFGFSRLLPGDKYQPQLMSIKGTPVYSSPQILDCQEFSSKCDVWSLGVMFYEMIMGQRPFKEENIVSLKNDIVLKTKNSKIQFPANCPISQNTQELIQKMLIFEEVGRVEWEQILQQKAFTMEESENIFQKVGANDDLANIKDKIHSSIIMNRNSIKQNIVREYMGTQNQNQYKYQSDLQQRNALQQPVALQQLQQQPQQQQQQQPLLQYQQLIPSEQSPVGIQQENNSNSPKKLTQDEQVQQQNQDLEIQQKFKLEGYNMIVSQNIDKYILFKRNVALFSNVALHCFWDTRSSYNLPNFVYRGIVLCCGGNYFHLFNQLNQIINLQTKQSKFSEFEFNIYICSQIFQKTKVQIGQDFQNAMSFFYTFQDVTVQELRQEYDQLKMNEQLKNNYWVLQQKNLLDFACKKSNEPTQYQQYCENLFQFIIQKQQLTQMDIQGLKGLRAIQLFLKNTAFFDEQHYLEFDFRKFYSEELQNVTQKQLILKIQQFNTQYLPAKQQSQ